MFRLPPRFSFFFFNDTATTEIYTLSLHDALPILPVDGRIEFNLGNLKKPDRHGRYLATISLRSLAASSPRSEEHTSELQSQSNLVCRLLLEKKKKGIER